MPIRRAHEQDLDAFVAVLVALAEEGQWIATEAPVDVDARKATLRGLLRAGDALFLVEDDDGTVLGNGGLHLTHRRGVAMIGMGLLPEARGKGLGRALLLTMIDHAVANRISRLELDVFPHNERAIALYRSAGFATEELRREHLLRRDGSRRDVLAMALAVPVSQ